MGTMLSLGHVIEFVVVLFDSVDDIFPHTKAICNIALIVSVINGLNMLDFLRFLCHISQHTLTSIYFFLDGLMASKIEGARRRRLKRRKHQLEEAPAIYALSGVGASLVPRHVSRTDAVPLAGIVSNCKWEEDWPTAQNMSRSLTTKKYKGKTIVVCPDLVDG
jgi:hypothetical protein